MPLKNPAPLPVEPPATGGYKYLPTIAKTAADHLAGWWRAFGGPAANNGTDVTSPLQHMAVTQTYDDAVVWGTVSVANTATRIDNANSAGAAVLLYRKGIFVSNEGDRDVFIGYGTGVTASGSAAGTVLHPGQTRWIPCGELLTVYAITASGTNALVKAEQWS